MRLQSDRLDEFHSCTLSIVLFITKKASVCHIALKTFFLTYLPIYILMYSFFPALEKAKLNYGFGVLT